MDKIVLSYHNSLIRESDFSLLDPPRWLNDKLIGFYFEFLELQFQRNGHKICFITPDVTQFIKLCKGPELAIFLEPLDLQSKELIILAINDNSSTESSGGSHWSTLVFDKTLNKYSHFDSSFSSSNFPSSKSCADKMSNFLKVDQPLIVNEKCPKQQNSYDCGVYTVLYAQFVANRKFNNLTKPIEDCINFESVSKWRTDTKDLICKLSQQFDDRRSD